MVGGHLEYSGTPRVFHGLLNERPISNKSVLHSYFKHY